MGREIFPGELLILFYTKINLIKRYKFRLLLSEIFFNKIVFPKIFPLYEIPGDIRIQLKRDSAAYKSENLLYSFN